MPTPGPRSAPPASQPCSAFRPGQQSCPQGHLQQATFPLGTVGVPYFMVLLRVSSGLGQEPQMLSLSLGPWRNPRPHGTHWPLPRTRRGAGTGGQRRGSIRPIWHRASAYWEAAPSTHCSAPWCPLVQGIRVDTDGDTVFHEVARQAQAGRCSLRGQVGSWGLSTRVRRSGQCPEGGH